MRRGRHARSVLTPCPPLRIRGEGERKGSPEFPLSTSWRGGQGVRLTRASEHVILSAAGAKDLLFVSAAPQQVHRARSPSCAMQPQAGPSLARVPRASVLTPCPPLRYAERGNDGRTEFPLSRRERGSKG